MSVLDEIVLKKRIEIESVKAARPLESLQEEAGRYTLDRRPFLDLFIASEKTVLIAEIKPKSPSAGQLIAESPLATADLYAKSEADAISVLTDLEYFGGSLELLCEVRSRVPQAIFRKDFIVDEYQIYEALLAGADAFLLIAHILEQHELAKFLALGTTLGLDTLVEVHDEEDLGKALDAGAEIIGINNRDLGTLEIDIHTTERLAKLIPAGTPLVSESGISSVADVRKVQEWGARGILVGTSILQSENPLKKIAELKAALAS